LRAVILTEAEFFHKEGKADGNLPAAGPGRDMDRLAREAGHGIVGLLRRARRRKTRADEERQHGGCDGAASRVRLQR